MQASIAYLLILLGLGLGIALGGIMDGVIGSVGSFLIHRVYTLSKRLAAIDEHLRHLDALTENAPLAPSAPPASGDPAPTPAVLPEPEPQATASTPQPPAPTEADPIIALNTTLQALLPALNALKATTPAAAQEPAHPAPITPEPAKRVQTATPTEPPYESVAIQIEKAELTEATEAAIAIEHVLLNALRDSMLGSASIRPMPGAPAPLTHQAAIEAPAPTTQEHMPIANGDRTSLLSPPVPNDLEHLRDELTTLMSDISAERARQTKAASKAPAEEEPADAKTLQELMIELRRLTAKMPPPQN